MKLYLIAGEPSGDSLGAALMAGLKQLRPDVTFIGIGGPLMQAEGLTSLFPMDELSVMGLAEVLPRLRHLFRRRNQAVADILKQIPDALITIDSPDFCLRVARKVKAASDIPTVHYVAPTVWAWRPKRAAKMAGVIDHVLALFPFEPPYMQAAGMTCDFVGHPIVAEPVADATDATAFRATHSIGEAPLVMILPGSRVGEVGRLSERFGAAWQIVLGRHPDARVVVPAAGPVFDIVREQTARWPGDVLVLDPNAAEAKVAKRAAFKAADVALAASGTVSLELAASGTPMVIAYDMNWLSRRMIKRMLLIDTVTLVNLVSETRTIPEFLGDRCRPDLIGGTIADLLQDEAARAAQLQACAVTMERLGRGGDAPGLRAARSVLDVISAGEV
ncbi:lipid-A-disaccharide synthase [Litoreibacter roseus]|uniref:Lipid-A-disaccharide synthase n=1 Tax=Litoreibacter roseus TaxID=2601869 RepID=A0A6N6JLT2_9RHOB|nr:lipid-A-disaccharide synthase [Litoreibacter roseus]GFE66830.1 lipid-A-disaccharide synthase [Litoreibacter roseus]